MYDYVIVGGGIVGLATAMTLGNSCPGAKILLLEKEQSPAQHQTGRNSGVIHSGIYYRPGTYKASFARAGNRSLVEFCRKYGIEHDLCGKVIVATRMSERPLLDKLFRRGLDHGLAVRRLAPEEVREMEPHVRCLSGIHVPTTGITDYKGVSRKYLELFQQAGGEAKFGNEVQRITDRGQSRVIEAKGSEYETRFLITCAGLQSDRVTRLAGVEPGVKIIPFRGEYYQLAPDKRDLVKGLIYPVPNPDFPFLGVHFTRMIDGSVHAGPNAVLAFKREGYRKTDFSLRDFCEIMSYRGFWKLAYKNLSEGLKEIYRSVSKTSFVRSLQQLIPEIQPADLFPCPAGVRAQALLNDGNLLDDFHMLRSRNALHVCNAPSPAATASLEIARAIVDEISTPGSVATALR
jgi:L-2-hydroxyglutarate oxidase